MAVGPQAAGVFDLGVGFGAVFFGHELDDGIDGLELDPEGLAGLGRVMAGDAGYVIVLRGFPGIVIRLHDVATVAKGGGGGVIKHVDEESQKSARDDGQHLVEFRTEMQLDPDPLQNPIHPFLRAFRFFQDKISFTKEEGGLPR